MAVSFPGKRSSEYRIDPLLVKINPQLNGRYELPEIDSLVADMLSMPDGKTIKGQTTPVIIGQDGKCQVGGETFSRPFLIAGHRRLRAVLKINKEKLTPEPMLLRCVYMQVTEAEALSVAVTENRERAGMTPLDESYTIKQFIRIGKDHEWIALHGGFFPKLSLADTTNGASPELKKAVAWVKKREKLLGLTEEAQKALAEGKIKPTAAEHLADLEADKQRELVKQETVTSADIAKAAGKSERPTLRSVREELEALLSDYAIKLPAEFNDRLEALIKRM